MYVRCAFFEGDVAPENRETFDRFFEEQAVPLISRFPNLRRVRLLRSEWREEGAPNVYQTIELTFDSRVDLEAALASPARQKNLDNTRDSGVMDLFDGRIYHINYDVPAMR